jgi:hypothetical protein
LYQFGRFADGHQERSNGNSGLARTATSNRASTITPSNNTIYGISSSVYDWASVDIDGGERGFNWDSRQFDWNPVVKGVSSIIMINITITYRWITLYWFFSYTA